MRVPRLRRFPLFYAILSLLVLIVPPVILTVQGASAFLRYTDGLLTQATPIVASEASKALGRTVTIGKLSPHLSLQSIYEAIRNPGSLHVVATDIALYHRPGEERLAGTPLLARAGQVSLSVSLPAILAADFNNALPRVMVDEVTLNLVRYKNGRLNVLDILPPQPKNKPAAAPILTFIEVNTGRLHFRDYAAKRPAVELPADNDLVIPQATVDLTGPRLVAWNARANATPGTATALRLGGIITVTGSAARGKSDETRPDAPDQSAPLYYAQIRAMDASIPYWASYLAPLPSGLKVTGGRGDFDATLAAPQPKPDAPPLGPTELPPGFNLSVSGRVRTVSLSAPGLPVPLTDAAGDFTYGDGAVTFNTGMRLLGEAIQARGVAWNLPQPGKPLNAGAISPNLSVTVDAPRIPVATALRTFVPAPAQRQLPKGLVLGGIAAVHATVGGVIALPAPGAKPSGAPVDLAPLLAGLVATGTASGLDASYPGYPAVRGVKATMTLAGGTLQLTNVSAALGAQGKIEGQGIVRLTGTAKERGNALFKARVSGIDLAGLRPVQEANQKAGAQLRLSGIGDVDIAGRLIAQKLTAAANVSTRGLRVGALSFPVARARVLVDDNRIAVPSARILSEAGSVTVNGNVSPGGDLNLHWSAAGIDLLAIGQAFGLDGLNGFLTATGTAVGTVQEPKVTVSNLYGMNLRFRTAAGGDGETRRIAVDLLENKGIIVTRHAVLLPEPLVLHRFPATISVEAVRDVKTNQFLPIVTNFLPARMGDKVDPILNLQAQVKQLDSEEIQSQASVNEPFSARRSIQVDQRNNAPLLPGLEDLPWNRSAAVLKQRPPTIIPLGKDIPPFGAIITEANVIVSGKLSTIRAHGDVAVDNAVVGPYPLLGASLKFDYRDKTTRLTDIAVNSTAGTLNGAATIAPKGTITGSFAAPRLDVQRLSFLTKGATALDGIVNLSGEFSGTITQPVVSATLTSDELSVSGTRLTDVAVKGVRYVGDLRQQNGKNAKPAGVVQVATLDLHQGKTGLDLSDLRYDLASGDVAAKLNLDIGDLGALVDAVRSSGINSSEAGAQVIRGLSRLPDTVGGSLSLVGVTLQGRIADGTLKDPLVGGELRGKNLKFGAFTTDNLEADASYKNGVVTLSRFLATRPDATIRASGTYDPEGQINVALDANQTSLEIVRTFPGLEGFPVRGKVDISVTAKGDSSHPDIRASLDGRDILISSGQATNLTEVVPALTAAATTTPTSNTAATAPNERGILLSTVTAIAYLERAKDGRTRLVTEARVAKDDAAVEVTGSLPFSFDPNDATLADQPLDLRLQVPRFDLAKLLGLLQTSDISSGPGTGTTPTTVATTPTPATKTNNKRGKKPAPAKSVDERTIKLAGTVDADVHVGGTLRQPSLGGSINVVDAQFTPPRAPSGDRDLISPVRDFDATLLFDGTNVYFKNTVLTLGGLNGEKGEFGTLALTGSIKVNNLENLQDYLKTGKKAAANPNAPRLDLNALWDIGAEFKGFRPAEDNLVGLGEAGRSRIEGKVAITGKLLTPLISTPKGNPLQLFNTEIRVPSLSQKESLPGAGGVFNPSFDVHLRVADRAAVTNPALFRFEAKGDADITGSLSKRVPIEQAGLSVEERRKLREQGYDHDYVSAPAFLVRADLLTVGGNVQLPTARFNVKKDGQIALKYGGADPGVYVTDLTAKTRIYAPKGVNFGADQSTGALAITTERPVSAPSVGYDITLTLNGRLDLLSDVSNLRGASGNSKVFSFQSDPPLQENQIVALLIPQQQFEQASQGRVEDAVRSFATQALTSGYLPRVLAPITQGVASTFGLEDLTVNYNPDAPLQVRLAKRLPEPLERFLVDFSRTFGSRNQPAQLQPYTFGLSYELYQFGRTLRFQPRLQTGFETDEQRTVTYFLRGSVSY